MARSLALEAGDVSRDDPAGAGRARGLAGDRRPRGRGHRPRGCHALGQLPDGAVRRAHPRRPVHVPRRRAPPRAGMPPHAIHGVGYDRPWRIVDDAPSRSTSTSAGRSGAGRPAVRAHRGVDVVRADARGGRADAGHDRLAPWFRRVLEPGDTPVELAFAADDDARPRRRRDAERARRVAAPAAALGRRLHRRPRRPGAHLARAPAPGRSGRAARGGSCTRSRRALDLRRATERAARRGQRDAPRSSSPARP